MHFEISHDFEIPLDALELAVLSPNLIEKLGSCLPNIDHVSQKEHALIDGVLERVWSYQADVKIPSFAKGYVTREMCAWDERTTYRIETHSSKWSIVPNVKPEWRKYFVGSGTYSLKSDNDGTTRRLVSGDLELCVPLVMKRIGERMIVNEIKKTFDAEAVVLRDLATLV